ncbi:MAG: 6-carboxytetrahydropterin synthase QueD [Spirulinaceae cyanobacterium]
MEDWTIYKDFRFEAAHRLPHHDGKCQRLHGHSWRGRVYVRGQALVTEGAKQGMLIDFGTIAAYLEPLVKDYLDHHYLNETLPLANPTSEAIAQWVYQELEAAGLPGLVAVEIKETCTSGCLYRRDASGMMPLP